MLHRPKEVGDRNDKACAVGDAPIGSDNEQSHRDEQMEMLVRDTEHRRRVGPTGSGWNYRPTDACRDFIRFDRTITAMRWPTIIGKEPPGGRRKDSNWSAA